MTTLLLGLAAPTLAQSEPEAAADETPAAEPANEEAPAADAAEGEGEAADAPAEDSTDEAAAGDFSGAVDTEGDIEDRVAGTSEPKFIKGHLVHPGTREYLSRYDHFGIRMGPAIIDNDFYAMVDPGIAMYTKGFAFARHVPLRLLAVDGKNIGAAQASFGGMRIRREDWDEVPDFARLIRFATIGRKEERFYLTINTMRPATIGHGMLMSGYQGNIDVDRSVTGVIFDAYNDYGGWQFQLNDITFTNKVIGGLLFVKPLSLFTDDINARSFSLGVEYITDLAAPKCVLIDEDSEQCVQGNNHGAGFDPYTGERLDDTFVRSDSTTGRPLVQTTQVEALGTSIEYKFLKIGREIDYKVYTTFHKYLNEGGGSGMALGALGRLNFGSEWIHALRLRSEYRNYGDGFIPNYFDSIYEVSKFSYTPKQRYYQVTPTKFQGIFGDDENGFVRDEIDRAHGFNVEAQWGIFRNNRRNKKVAVGVGLSDSTRPDDSNFYFHVEFPWLGFFQVFGTYMRTGAESMASLFGSDMFTHQDTILLAGSRLQLLPVLFLNAHYSRSFRTTRGPGREYHLGTEAVQDASGNYSTDYSVDVLFENVPTVFVELEFGWEFEPDNTFEAAEKQASMAPEAVADEDDDESEPELSPLKSSSTMASF
ncbi:MAG: hypothetical protein VX834_07960 [Myxococcota bacterium]|nr:hypothetical protein [Myxococcota bacterium]